MLRQTLCICSWCGLSSLVAYCKTRWAEIQATDAFFWRHPIWSQRLAHSLTFVVFHRRLYPNFRHIFCVQRIHAGGDVRAVVLENLNDRVVLVAAKTSGATMKRLFFPPPSFLFSNVCKKWWVCVRLPSHEEVRQSGEKGPHGHEETARGNESGPMQLGPKMADHSEKQQVAYLQRKRNQESSRKH